MFNGILVRRDIFVNQGQGLETTQLDTASCSIARSNSTTKGKKIKLKIRDFEGLKHTIRGGINISHTEKVFIENFHEFEFFAEAIVYITLNKMNIDAELVSDIMIEIRDEVYGRTPYSDTFAEGSS